jgi:hypothetical protein
MILIDYLQALPRTQYLVLIMAPEPNETYMVYSGLVEEMKSDLDKYWSHSVIFHSSAFDINEHHMLVVHIKKKK